MSLVIYWLLLIAATIWRCQQLGNSNTFELWSAGNKLFRAYWIHAYSLLRSDAKLRTWILDAPVKVELLEISCRNSITENCYQRKIPTSDKKGKYKSVKKTIYVETHLTSGWERQIQQTCKTSGKRVQLRTMRDERECRD